MPDTPDRSSPADDDAPALLRPRPPRTWRERLEQLADATGSSPARIVVGAVVVAAWPWPAGCGCCGRRRIRRRPPCPFASTTVASPPTTVVDGPGAPRGPRGRRGRAPGRARAATGEPGRRRHRRRRRAHAAGRRRAHQPRRPGGRRRARLRPRGRRAGAAGGGGHRGIGRRRVAGGPGEPQHRRRRGARRPPRGRPGDRGGDHRAPRQGRAPSPPSTSCSTCPASATPSSRRCATWSPCDRRRPVARRWPPPRPRGALVPARGSLWRSGWWSPRSPRCSGGRSLRWLAVALLASGLAQRSLDGLDGVEPGIVAGEVTLLSDPAPHFEGVRVDVRWGHRRLEAHARGVSADALRPRLAGEVVTVRGTVRPVEPGQPWLVARHIAGELTVLRVDGWRPGDPASRLANGLRRTLVAGAAPLEPRARSLYTGLVIGDDREQPADLADSFRGAGLTHLLAVSGQNVAFALALAGPLLRRLRLWPRLVATLVVIGLFGRDDALRAVGAAGLGDGGAGGDARDAGRSRSRGCGSSGSPSPRWCWSIRCSCARPASSCRSAPRVAIVVLAPRLASVLPGPAAAARGRGRDAGRAARRRARAARDLRPDPGGVAAGQPPLRPGRRARDGLGPHRRPRRRRRPARRWPRSSTSRRGSRSAGSSWSPSAPRRRRSASCTSPQVVALAGRAGGRSSSPARGRRGAPAGRPLAVGAVLTAVRGRPRARAAARAARARGGPLARRRRRRGRARRCGRPVDASAAPACSSRCAARASAPSTCSWSPTPRCPTSVVDLVRRRPPRSVRRARAAGRRRPPSSSARSTVRDRRGARPAGRRRRASRAMRAPRRRRGRFGARGAVALDGGVAGAVPHRRPRAPPLRRPPPRARDGHPQPHARLVLRPGPLLRLRRVPRQGRAARRRGRRLPRRRRGEGRARARRSAPRRSSSG